MLRGGAFTAFKGVKSNGLWRCSLFDHYFPSIVHIKMKKLKSNGIFLQSLPSTKFTSNLKSFTHRIQVT